MSAVRLNDAAGRDAAVWPDELPECPDLTSDAVAASGYYALDVAADEDFYSELDSSRWGLIEVLMKHFYLDVDRAHCDAAVAASDSWSHAAG